MKQKIDIGLVIVNFNNYFDTIEYVNSFLEKIDTENYFIVIVDNCSKNESVNILSKEFLDNKKIEILASKVNSGYSSACNLGFAYLNEFFDSRFIIASNADILFIDEHFFNHVSEEYEQSKFAVLAPLIITPDGKCNSNPIFDCEYTRGNAMYDLKYWKKRLLATKLGMDRFYCFCRRHNFFVKKYKKKHYVQRKDKSIVCVVRREGIVPHGCFLVLSKQYFSVFNGFDARTFLYAEEDILYMHLISMGLKTVYLPTTMIYHKGGSSLETLEKKPKEKKIFLFKNFVSAISEYLKLLDELGK